MTITGLSSNYVQANVQAWQTTILQRQQAFNQQASAIQNGNFTAVQKVSCNSQGLQSGNEGQNITTNSTIGSTGVPGNSNNTIAKDFATLGQALQSGNLNDAQNAFAQLQTDMQTQKGGYHRHHHHHHEENETSPSSSSNASSQGTSQNNSISSPSTAGSTDSSINAIAKDFTTLGQAIKSGNLSDAQNAFAQLQTDMQAQKGGYNTGGGNGTYHPSGNNQNISISLTFTENISVSISA